MTSTPTRICLEGNHQTKEIVQVIYDDITTYIQKADSWGSAHKPFSWESTWNKWIKNGFANETNHASLAHIVYDKHPVPPDEKRPKQLVVQHIFKQIPILVRMYKIICNNEIEYLEKIVETSTTMAHQNKTKETDDLTSTESKIKLHILQDLTSINKLESNQNHSSESDWTNILSTTNKRNQKKSPHLTESHNK